MKRFLSTILFITLLLPLLYSQSPYKIRQVAQQYFDQQLFKEAAIYFNELVGLNPRDIQSRFKLAESLYHSLQYSKAIEHFRVVANSKDSLNKEAQHLYAQTLKMDGQYKMADSVFYILLENELYDESLRSSIFNQKEGCQLAMRQAETKKASPITKLEGINTDFFEFGLSQNPKTKSLTILTTRKLKSRQYPDEKYGGYLPDLVRFIQNEKGWNMMKNDDGFQQLNTPYAEGSGTYTNDGNTFYFTSCSNNQGGQCQIYRSRLSSDKWSTPVVLPETINKPGFQAQHPFITGGGDTLFFVSDRTGTFGGMDIWMSLRGRNDVWSPAINLGTAINTEEDEISPYFSESFRALLFASHGHTGYGGFDLFLAKGITFFEPQIYNLGPPYNTSLDDAYFYMGQSVGFLSSNRNEARDMDIFHFPVEDENDFLSGFMTRDDLSGRRLAMAKFKQLRSLDLQTFRTDDLFGYNIYRPIPDKYEVKNSISRYKYVNVNGNIHDPNTPVRIFVSDSLELLTLSNDDSRFSFKLLVDSLHNLDNDYSFHSESTIESHHLADTAGIFVPHFYENLYFDFGSHDLRPEASIALDEIISNFDQKNVALIDIQTHTDDKGNYDFNFRLSEKRGIAIMSYLKERGFPSTKMRVVAHGEENPRAINDSWYGRLYNRRAEITIYNQTVTDFSKPKLFVVRDRMTIDEASRLLGVTQDHISERNGSGRTSFSQGQVLRVVNPQYFTVNVKYLIEESDLDNVIIPYVVRSGDSLESISNKFKIPEEFILETNHITGDLKAGQEIILYQLDSSINAPQL